MSASLRHLAGSGWWAGIDQATFSAANFLLNLVLARSLAPDEFGAFALAFSILVLLGTLHSALLTEPMLVLAPARHRHRLADYLRVLVEGHAALTGVFAAGLLIAALCARSTGNTALSAALAADAVAVPCVLLLWLARRACYVPLEPRLAAVAGIAYLALIVAVAALAAGQGLLTPAGALTGMATASLLSAGWLLHRLGLDRSRPAPGLFRTVAAEHWAYGRHAVLSAGLVWVPGNIYFLALPAFGAMSDAGEFRAMLLLLMPLLLSQGALGLVLLSAMANSPSRAEATRLLRIGVVATGIGSLVYGALLVLLSSHLGRWMFADRYPELGSFMPLVALVGLTEGHAAVMACRLRAAVRPDLITRSAVIASLVTAATGLPLAWFHGAGGALLGWLLASATFAWSLQVAARKIILSTGASPAERVASSLAATARIQIGDSH
jgi:O-antigen/teichoic acid export membrane protein